MNVIDLLKKQHKEVKALLERIENDDDKKEAKALVAEVGKALRLHMLIEEKLVYPTAARAFAGNDEEEDEVLEAFEEHATARGALEVLERTPAKDKRLSVRAKVLRELLEHHIEEEEKEFFPDIEKELGDEAMEKLSAQAEKKIPQFEREASGKPAPRASTTARRGRTARGGTTTRQTKAGGARRSAR
ncbi:MAG TPA: hemerythrin domain-containing protein [Polyangiaceae bacterium]|jgi:hemerythrin-like domain-containing protein